MFRFQQINLGGNNPLGQTSLILNKASGKAIDVPAATVKKG